MHVGVGWWKSPVSNGRPILPLGNRIESSQKDEGLRWEVNTVTREGHEAEGKGTDR